MDEFEMINKGAAAFASDASTQEETLQETEIPTNRRLQSSKWDKLTEAQKNWCYLMAYDPDNPDIPMD